MSSLMMLSSTFSYRKETRHLHAAMLDSLEALLAQNGVALLSFRHHTCKGHLPQDDLAFLQMAEKRGFSYELLKETNESELNREKTLVKERKEAGKEMEAEGKTDKAGEGDKGGMGARGRQSVRDRDGEEEEEEEKEGPTFLYKITRKQAPERRDRRKVPEEVTPLRDRPGCVHLPTEMSDTLYITGLPREYVSCSYFHAKHSRHPPE